jgi:hypothetical protein
VAGIADVPQDDVIAPSRVGGEEAAVAADGDGAADLV